MVGCRMGGYGRVSALPFKVLGPLRGEMSLLSTGAEHLFTSSQGLLLGDQVSAAEIPLSLRHRKKPGGVICSFRIRVRNLCWNLPDLENQR